MRELYMKSGQGFLLVFSITSLASLIELHELRDQICRIKDSSSVPLSSSVINPISKRIALYHDPGASPSVRHGTRRTTRPARVEEQMSTRLLLTSVDKLSGKMSRLCKSGTWRAASDLGDRRQQGSGVVVEGSTRSGHHVQVTMGVVVFCDQ